MIGYSSQCSLIIITLCLLTTIYFVFYLPKIVFFADCKLCIIWTKQQKTSKLSLISSKSFSDKIQWEYKALRNVLIAASNVTTEPMMVTICNLGTELVMQYLWNGNSFQGIVSFIYKNKPYASGTKPFRCTVFVSFLSTFYW